MTANKDVGESVIKDIIKGPIYNINIQGCDVTKSSDEYRNLSLDIAIWTDKISQDILHKLFRILQTECGIVTNLMGSEDRFSGLSNVLFQNFHKDFKEQKDLEISIKDKINELEEYNFLSPKSLYEKYDTIKDSLEYISLNEVKELILMLRKRRIKIFKTLLNDYRIEKDKYLEFMKESNKYI